MADHDATARSAALFPAAPGGAPPQDADEQVWALLSHLQLAPGAFVALLGEPLPDGRNPYCFLVRCNPLLQLRSVLERCLPDAGSWEGNAAAHKLQALLAAHDTRITPRGRFDCGIHTRQRFASDPAWQRVRVLAAQALQLAGLPPWPLVRPCSYLAAASWCESEDEIHAVLRRGGDPLQLPWIRVQLRARWEPG